MTPSWRKPVGAIGISVFIVVWVVLVTSFSHIIGGWHVAAQTIVYVVAGVAWIAPLKPVLQWMETGTLRPPE